MFYLLKKTTLSLYKKPLPSKKKKKLVWVVTYFTECSPSFFPPHFLLPFFLENNYSYIF